MKTAPRTLDALERAIAEDARADALPTGAKFLDGVDTRVLAGMIHDARLSGELLDALRQFKDASDLVANHVHHVAHIGKREAFRRARETASKLIAKAEARS